MAEADRMILEGRLEVVEREKKELEGRLRAETERRKKAEEEEVKLRASTPAPTPSPSTTAGNGTAEMDKLRAELRQNKFVIERLAGKVKELNKEVSDRRDENGASRGFPSSVGRDYRRDERGRLRGGSRRRSPDETKADIRARLALAADLLSRLAAVDAA